MERKSELTKALLGEKFKELVAKKGFEKLTIKMITDAAGVIRPTFYNYFQDKYEVMEWLLWEDVFKEVSELMEQEHGMESLQLLFQRFGEDKTYYEKVFEVTGQNSFEEMLYGQVFHMEEILVKHHPLKHLRNMRQCLDLMLNLELRCQSISHTYQQKILFVQQLDKVTMLMHQFRLQDMQLH